MDCTASQARAHRLRAHHLDQKLPPAEMERAAGACGLQNSPPGSWETALYNRLQGASLPALHAALEEDKTLLQAWSYRGAPVVFPTAEGGVFLTPLIAREGEQPWVYTRGVSAGLDFVRMEFDQALALVKQAARLLDGRVVAGKEALDQALADAVRPRLPPWQQALWDAPSLYGRPDRQTVGGAVVSFLLRPCAFSGLVVFGARQGAGPTFTSCQNWLGHGLAPVKEGEKALVRKFLHCYGPAAPGDLAAWLGCSPRQAKRLWAGVEDELAPVRLEGRAAWMLAQDAAALPADGCEGDRLLLLGPHDPYLDLRDKATILPEEARRRQVWKTVANPGAVLRGGRVIGVWNAKTAGGKLEVSLTLWEAARPAERHTLQTLAGEYAAFRGLALRGYAVRGE